MVAGERGDAGWALVVGAGSEPAIPVPRRGPGAAQRAGRGQPLQPMGGWTLLGQAWLADLMGIRGLCLRVSPEKVCRWPSEQLEAVQYQPIEQADAGHVQQLQAQPISRSLQQPAA